MRDLKRTGIYGSFQILLFDSGNYSVPMIGTTDNGEFYCCHKPGVGIYKKNLLYCPQKAVIVNKKPKKTDIMAYCGHIQKNCLPMPNKLWKFGHNGMIFLYMPKDIRMIIPRFPNNAFGNIYLSSGYVSGKTLNSNQLIQEGPIEEGPIQEGPIEEGPIEEGPIEEGPIQEDPIQESARTSFSLLR